MTQTAAEEGVDWFVWRLVLHPRRPGSLVEVADLWSTGEVTAAHMALDAIEDIEQYHRDNPAKG